tara:strand:- start:3186 stop:3365 length:180 start_codon:yes stop_codon:yes gene_type:complete
MKYKIGEKLKALKAKSLDLICDLSDEGKSPGEIKEIHSELYAIDYTLKEIESLIIELCN